MKYAWQLFRCFYHKNVLTTFTKPLPHTISFDLLARNNEYYLRLLEGETVSLPSPPGVNLITHHQMLNMVAWWKTWRNVIWAHFLRSTIKKVSLNSITFEKKYHHSTFATCNKYTELLFLPASLIFQGKKLNQNWQKCYSQHETLS